MRWSVESWDPSYGQPAGDLDLDDREADTVVDVEVPAGRWEPRAVTPRAEPATVVFVDGVRRVDARAWIHAPDESVSVALCATYAAGAVRCVPPPGRAELAAVLVERGLFTPSPHAADIVTRAGVYSRRTVGSARPEALPLALQARMGELEGSAAEAGCTPGCDLLVVDGPLRGRGHLPNAVGYVKTHHVAYLPAPQHAVVERLRPGERTPLFATGSAFSRYAWYFRLPGGGATPWAGVVRLEASADLAVGEVVLLADRACALLPRFASEAHKDPRAPQNLYPIAGLERELRRRLGDEGLLYRALRLAAA